jgi:hypothetical protein
MSVPFAATSDSDPDHATPAGIPTQAPPRGPEFVVPDRYAIQPPADGPASNQVAPAGRAPAWNTIFAVSLAALASVYAMASLVKACLLYADADLLTKIMNNPTTVTLDQVHSLASLERATNGPYLALLYLTFLAYVIWIFTLNSRLKALGRPDALRGIPAMRVWQIGVLISLATLWITRTPAAGSSLSDFISADHRAIAYMLVRVIVAALYVWVAISLRAKTDPALADARPA